MISKSKELDQFYTHEEVAIECYNEIKRIIKIEDYFLLEPSAGTGSFSNLFHNNSLALDIEPKNKGIKKSNFLEFNIKNLKEKKVITIGNPPFGKNSSLAIKFFNKSAEFSEFICFIIPKTFKKDSVINKLNQNMFLIKEKEIKEDSFIFEGEKYKVPCIFQIWKKENHKREKIRILKKSEYFDFSTKDNCDFAIRRVGGLAGKVLIDFKQYSKSSHYFIKSNKKLSKEKLLNKFNNLYSKFQITAFNSVGNPSLSKNELIKIFENL